MYLIVPIFIWLCIQNLKRSMRICLAWSSMLFGLPEVKLRDGILKENETSLKINQARSSSQPLILCHPWKFFQRDMKDPTSRDWILSFRVFNLFVHWQLLPFFFLFLSSITLQTDLSLSAYLFMLFLTSCN